MRLILDTVSVNLGQRRILDGVSAELQGGELIALVGPNGAGKTTLLRAIAGLIGHQGQITLDGEAIAAMPPGKRARRIAWLPQGHQTHWPLPVREIVALGRFPHGASDPRRLSAADAALVDQAMAAAGIAALADQSADALSGGEKARVALARVLAVQAPVILADEPTASLDPKHQLAAMAVLREATRNGALVIAILHDLDHAAHFADRALVLNAGRLAASGTTAEALSPALLQSVFGIARRDGRWQAAP